MITRIAPAKINLALHVVGKRADGYHLIESLVGFTDVGDKITTELAEGITLDVRGKFADMCGDNADNLAFRAATLLRAHLGEKRGAHITLTKHIPVGAGLGGGSSDAAATVHMLLALWQRIMPRVKLVALLSPLGADMAMCLSAQPCIARGIGDELEVLSIFPRIPVLLVYPKIILPTVNVYRAYTHEASVTRKLSYDTHSVSALLSSLTDTANMLTRAATACTPLVAEALLALETLPQQPELVRMTGSGACCVAYFDEASRADSAEKTMRAQYPNWWIQRAHIIGI